ncbi:RHS repeat domain-containing protein [Pseudomonas helleri]|uniref:RHS repeat domain-containing protein n=1 Tax=Pseudomonas helleri TaxID=1608996 RepID=UPI003FD5BA42
MPASLHQHTPSLIALDPRGLSIRQVAYYRQNAHDAVQARINRNAFNPLGVLKEQWDPRLSVLHENDTSVRPNQRMSYSLSGRLLLSDSVDQGQGISWLGSSGQVIRRWDSRGACQTFEYDHLLRLTGVAEQASDESAPVVVEQLIYGSSTRGEAIRNRCGRLITHVDPAGDVRFESYDVLGQLSKQIRRFSDEQQDSAGHASTWRYQASGELAEQVDAKGNLQRTGYAVDGLLTGVSVTLARGSAQTLVEQRVYSASGQVLSERAGNGVVSALEYNALDQRLQRLRCYRSGKAEEPLQDLSYIYDRVGNVLSVSDAAQPVQWFDNTRTEAQNTYRYDSLYRLIEATGRESTRAASGSGLLEAVPFGSTQANLSRHYRQNYRYDASGNLSALRHLPAQATGYTRKMNIATHSNHGVEQVPAGLAPGLGSGFDKNGYQLALQPGQTLSWNVRNQLQRVIQVVRPDGEDDDETYRYDSSGQRVLKIRRSVAKNQSHRSEVRYLPGLEIHHNSATGEWLNTVVVSGALHSIRILQWEQGRPEGIENEQIRFALSDNLGSSTLELDGSARVLSQETYYPYGGTAWWAAKNAVDASYKTIRYSGKERDASGLYYYGYRYYAPWLGRWINADPGGDIDGLNLYAMASGNPVSYVDSQGMDSKKVALGVPVSRFSQLRGAAMRFSERIRPALQAASSAAIRDSLATHASNALGVGVDLLLFAGRQPTRVLNTVLRQVVAVLDGLALGHMATGLLGNWPRLSPIAGVAAFAAADRGFAIMGHGDAVDVDQEWDPVARERFIGHVRAFSREVGQQIVRGLGTTVSWGQTPLAARAPRTLLAAAAYGLATIPNAIYNSSIPGSLVPNVGPLIEGYDAGAASLIRAGHATAVYEAHVDAIQLPDLEATGHGGLSRMLNQVWGYWSGVGIEAIATLVTGQPASGQSSRTRFWVGAARGVMTALTEFRGLLVLTARRGYTRISSLWRTPPR